MTRRRRPTRDEDGYRYVREHRSWPTGIGVALGERVVTRWALWERRNGVVVRAGTATSQSEADAFINNKESYGR
jgi:hypothetical protein